MQPDLYRCGAHSRIIRAVETAAGRGMIADALSMGSSGYLAAKSEREVCQHEIVKGHRIFPRYGH